jgi:cytidylate kinase
MNSFCANMMKFNREMIQVQKYNKLELVDTNDTEIYTFV